MNGDRAAEILDRASRELALSCTPAGEIVWGDARAQRHLGARPGVNLMSLAAPGVEDKARAFLTAAGGAPVERWEVPLVVAGRVATVWLSGAPHDGNIVVLGSLLPDDYAASATSVGSALAEIVELNREIGRQKREIERRQAELLAVNAELGESNRGILALHRELEEKAGSLAEGAEVKARLVAHVSHEFRTPLNSIIGLASLLLDRVDGPLTAEQETQVRFIRGAAEELGQLVNDLLDFSKVEAGRASLRAERFTAAEFLAAVRGTMRPLAGPDSPRLVFDEPPDVELETDQAKLAQLLRNLVSNALKFTPKTGEVRISVNVSDARNVTFSVRDDGIGIAPEDQERVFEEFAQVASAQGAHKGTGLGLPLARQLAEFLGGRLDLESAKGVGSTFTLTIPRVHADVEQLSRIAQRGAQAHGARAPILVVEDDRRTILLYERYLAMAGLPVIPARSIDEARSALTRTRPAAILLDIMLEGEASWSLLHDLKSDPATCDIPVLVITVTNREQKARALGADEFWLKPIDGDRLLRRLQSVSKPARAARILVIDDDETARYLVRKLLGGTDFGILEAATGDEGVKIARAVQPDVILLDFLLSGMTAFDVLDELKADPHTRHIPVIIVTAHALPAADRDRLAACTEEILAKDKLSRELAIHRIRDALRRAGLTARGVS